MTERRQLDPEATRHAILEAADALFVDRGFAAVSLSQIAREAEVTKSLIHHHFGTKRELWKEVKRRRMEGFAQAQREIIAEIGGAIAPLDAIGATMRNQHQNLNADPAMGRIMSWSHLNDEMEDMVPMADVLQGGIERIRAAQERGEFRADVPAHVILHVMLGTTTSWMMYRRLFMAAGIIDAEQAEDPHAIEDMIALVTRGVEPD
jgi:TetR/AcrR family transcriptional regulator